MLSVEEGIQLKALAAEHGLKVGSAPDTFLGGAHQQARSIIDSGKLGRIASGTMHVMSRGMEHWHPNPDFFFQPGGGLILDLGPYYITDLISLVGPIKRVSAFTGMARTEREVTAEGPYKGTFIKVGTPTTIHAILEFHSGAIITLGASWDVASHGHHNIELYGTEGSVYVPDPNFFNGDVTITDITGAKEKVTPWDHPFGVANQGLDTPNPRANYRNAGLSRHDGRVRDRPARPLRPRYGPACRRRHGLDPQGRRDRPGDHAANHLRTPGRLRPGRSSRPAALSFSLTMEKARERSRAFLVSARAATYANTASCTGSNVTLGWMPLGRLGAILAARTAPNLPGSATSRSPSSRWR